MPNPTPTESLKAAISLFPTLKAFAEALGVTYQVVQQWLINGVPVDKCAAVEAIGGGVASRKTLRPDDWQEIWPELANPSKCKESRTTQ